MLADADTGSSHLQFLQDLAVVMIVAAVVTVIFHRLRQPVVLGYIIAGVIVGPYTSIPLSVHDKVTIQIMAELGVILLMFSLGLHFSLRQLAQVGATALVAASLEILAMILIGYAIGRMFHWSQVDSLFLGAILSISSTTIIVKALADLKRDKEEFARLIFGILIVEDILAIAIIALLPGVATHGSLPLRELIVTLGKLAIFLTSVLVVGLLAVPWLLRYINRFKSNEMMLITTLGLCFGVSLLAAYMGYSVALGAFLIGAIVAEAREHGKVQIVIEPVRDMFSAIFFVAVGMMIQPQMLRTYAVPIAVITVAVVVGKVLTCGFGTFVAGHDARTALRVGMGLAQIGEFSFIIAQLGLTLQKTGEFLYPIAVTVSAITTLLTPYLIRSSDAVASFMGRISPEPLSAHVELYSRWMAGRAHSPRDRNQVRRLLRKWMLQILLNGTLAAGIFIAAAWLARRADRDWPNLPRWLRWTGGAKSLIWSATMVLVLPLFIVTYRKLRAVAMVLAEMSVTRTEAGDQTAAIRNVVSTTVLTAGMIAIALIAMLLSSTILPPWPVMIVLGAFIITLAALNWRRFERVYARAQIALRETLTRPAEPAAPADMPAMLHDAQLETVEIEPSSPAAGKLIRELQLRTRSGASAVGIERDGTNIISPGPDEELHVGDKVLVLGTAGQLDAARRMLSRAEPKSPQ